MNEDNSKNLPMIRDISKSKQEKANEDIDKIIHEFPIEASKINQVVDSLKIC